MIALQKQYGPFIVELRVEDNKVTQYEEGKKIRVWPGLYESCFDISFNTAYVLNKDLYVAEKLESLGFGKIVSNNTPYKTGDVVDWKKYFTSKKYN